MRIVSTQGATALQHDGIDYQAGEGGVFEVPQEVGEALVRFPHWLREYEAVDLRNAAAAKAETDTSVLATRVRELEAQLAAQQPSEDAATLEARVAELEAQLAEATAAKTAAKKTTTKKTAAESAGDGSDAGA